MFLAWVRLVYSCFSTIGSTQDERTTVIPLKGVSRDGHLLELAPLQRNNLRGRTYLKSSDSITGAMRTSRRLLYALCGLQFGFKLS